MTRMLWSLMLLSMMAGLSACSLLERSDESGYADDYEFRPGQSGREFYRERQMHIESEAREELGFDYGNTLSEIQRNVLNDRLALKRLEKQLPSNREKRQYYKYRAAMKSDRERMTFLSIPSVEGRERWATNHGLAEKSNTSPVMADIIEKNDVAVGMDQNSVMQSWGDPDVVEVAGNPVYGNERWKYSKYVSSDEGFQKQTRVIYFESGRVVGWETF